MVATTFRIVLHRLAVGGVLKMLVLALFVVATAEPVAAAGLATSTSAQSVPSRIAIGGSAQVYALVAVADGSTAIGTVEFHACAPAETAGGRCLAGTAFGTRPLDAGGAALSPPIAPSLAGTWCFRVAYSGSATVSGSQSTTACLVVDGHATTTTLTAAATEVPVDTPTTATASVAAAGPTPTGDVRFSVCPADGSTVPICLAPPVSIGTTALDTNGSAASPGFAPPEAGLWCFRATYLGGGAHEPSSTFGACFVAIAPPPASSPTEPDDGATGPPPERRGPGAWHQERDWPVDGLTLGGVAYTNDAARALLTAPARGDAGHILVRHLVAAKLDRAVGATGPEADAGIAAADALLAALGGPGGGARMAKGVGAEVGQTIALIEG